MNISELDSSKVQEAVVLGILVVSLTVMCGLDKITGEQYINMLGILAAYTFGRVLNHAQQKE